MYGKIMSHFCENSLTFLWPVYFLWFFFVLHKTYKYLFISIFNFILRIGILGHFFISCSLLNYVFYIYNS